ncbi:MAG: hypothetical protein WCQ49_02465 [Candidatus Saccharibacteria bacterium]
MSNNEILNNASQEVKTQKSDFAAEQLAKLEKQNKSELPKEEIEQDIESARVEAFKNAISVEKKSDSEKSNDSAPRSRRGQINKKQLNESYKKTLKQIQTELTPASRGFSKIIHNNVVEKTSELIGSTVARPNAILLGAFTAFVLTLVVYLTAKNIGYRLSGSETIISFFVGWLIGILIDYIRIIFTGKK